ncbi:hypothetical protein [Streptomyces fuscichromogenes]|uniref:Uncharacterized protein n=1 Tax=Streptomyces fuscichromogenes TaxID=1324013 RepID=A0A917XGU0_9ACTN|nr:hypothetical protein [Streptomyces fuscichromogenes]GGN24319.1 hypothetical protein GCM10011578_057400 [Streptomyces fuscichromogenes]
MNEYIGRSLVTAAGGSWAWAFGRPAAAGAEEPPAGSGRAARIRGAQAIQGARAARAATATARAQATARDHAQALQNRAAHMLADTVPGHLPFPSAVTPMAPEAGREA